MSVNFPTALTVGDAVTLRREGVRSRLAYLVLGLLIALTVTIVLMVILGSGVDKAQLLITGLFGPIIGIAGTVLGFYFGAESQKAP